MGVSLLRNWVVKLLPIYFSVTEGKNFFLLLSSEDAQVRVSLCKL